MAKDDTDGFAASWQRDHENQIENRGIARLLTYLRLKGALRDSMIDGTGGFEWLVLYTEDGAIDIKANDLWTESLQEAARKRYEAILDAANTLDADKD